MTIAAEKALTVDGVAVSIDGKPIVGQCAFSVDRGEFIGLIGPNGAGKTTLLKGIRGMLPLESGEVRVFGRLLHSLGDKHAARLVAYMQQEVNAGFGFTALDVVLAGRYPYLKWWQNETEADHGIARKYMAFTGVESLADKPVTQVSGGERQRILLAKVLAQETPLIFLDEPTASLDLVYQEEIFRYCQTVCKAGKTVLLIAHDIRLAAKFCSRLILLAGGRIVADGAPAAVITADNLAKAYGLHSAVFINRVSGNLDIHTYEAPAAGNRRRIHIIGGGGATGDIMRRLHEHGYSLSAGVLQDGDTDTDTAKAFGLECVTGLAFSPITGQQAQDNRDKIAAADLVVLGNLCYSRQNFDNLQAAFAAKHLIVLEDSPIAGRDFTGGEAAALYRELVSGRQVTVMTSAQLLQKMADCACGKTG